ncbi:MAG: AgmX/PglI C-terminal domain-containing protein, partial [Proteobacteria bacterium]
ANLYAERFQDDARRAREAGDKREEKEEKQLSDKRNGLVAIPVVRGEALNAKLLRVQKTLASWYESTAYMVDLRGKTTADFAQDKGYDFKNYKTVEKGAPKAKAPFKQTGDEELMYKTAEGVAEAAARERKALSKLRTKFEPLRPETSRPLSFAQGSDYTPSMTGREFIELNRKIDGIMASLFDPEKPKKIQEPIIGTLDPRLIEKTVDRSRFELQLCYELALRRNQAAAGLMEWRWNLDTKGRVTDLELIDSDISDGKMISCIRDKLSRWTWPKPLKGTVQVSFPFSFKPSKG